MKFYRYELHSYGSVDEFDNYVRSSTRLEVYEYHLVKETAKGYWISYFEGASSGDRWISKTAKKRFAYPTLEEALEGYIKRSERHKAILEARLRDVNIGLELAKNIKDRGVYNQPVEDPDFIYLETFGFEV